MGGGTTRGKPLSRCLLRVGLFQVPIRWTGSAIATMISGVSKKKWPAIAGLLVVELACGSRTGFESPSSGVRQCPAESACPSGSSSGVVDGGGSDGTDGSAEGSSSGPR